MGTSPDRLRFVLAPEPPVARRVAALLAAGALAVSGGLAASAVASESDSQDEGPAAPEQPTTGDEVGGSGEETPLPDVVPVPPGESEPDAPADEGATPPSAGDPAPDGEPLSVDGPDAPPGEEAAPLTVAPLPVQQPSTPPPSSPPSAGGGADSAPLVVEDAHASSSVPALWLTRGRPAGSARAAVKSVTVVASPANTAPAATSTVLRGGARVYVVRRGDSLWSIAADLVGPHAGAAAVASRVARLWRLNRARIGTGNPDVLPVGVRLRLR